MWLKALLVILYKVSGPKEVLFILKITLKSEIYYMEHLIVLQMKGTAKYTSDLLTLCI